MPNGESQIISPIFFGWEIVNSQSLLADSGLLRVLPRITFRVVWNSNFVLKLKKKKSNFLKVKG